MDPDHLTGFVVEGGREGLLMLPPDKAGNSIEIAAEISTNINVLAFMRNIRMNLMTDPHQTFPYLLCDLGHRQVKEPVDRIWAVAALISGHTRDKLAEVVDYSDAGRTQYWNIFLAAFTILINERHDLRFLDIPPTLDHRLDILPSWCRDISKTFACKLSWCGLWNIPVTSYAQFYPHLFTRSDNDETESDARYLAVEHHERKFVSASQHGKSLRARGFLVDSITEVLSDPQLQGATDYMQDGFLLRMLRNPLHKRNMRWHLNGLGLVRRLLSDSGREATDFPQDYLMTLFTDCRVRTDLQAVYDRTMKLLTQDDQTHPVLTAAEDLAVRGFIDRFRELTGHAFFATAKGRFGIAQSGCEVGDGVYVLYGGQPLYIMRSSEDDSRPNSVKFRCTAFIPHLMEPYQSDAERKGLDQIFTMI